jgi:tRNA(adenine34) deaminase
MFSKADVHWMQLALSLAQEARDAGEVPVGAVLVKDDLLLATGKNSPIVQHDPSAHAEIAALRQAAEKTANYRLPGTTLYVTLEPCLMCAGAMVHARIQRLVYGAYDLKTGVIDSRMRIFEQAFLNHRVQYAGGLMAGACGELLTEFFRARR